MKYRVTVLGSTREVEVDGHRVIVDGIEVTAGLRAIDGTPLSLLLLDHSSRILPMESKGRGVWHIQDSAETLEVEVLDERAAHIRSRVGVASVATGPALLKAPMPGLVVRVLVEPGEEVLTGQGVVVLEAMKMENELKASAAGIVERIEVTPGQPVEKGAVLVAFKAVPVASQ